MVGIAVGEQWRMVTAIFLHGGILHLLMNAYALWIFGPVVERELGRVRFLLIFLTTGLFASAASYAFASNPVQVSVGASGAIFGVVGAFVAYNYRHRELALAAARLRGLVPFLILNMVLPSASTPFIDWRAHLGGFVAGLGGRHRRRGLGHALDAHGDRGRGFRRAHGRRARARGVEDGAVPRPSSLRSSERPWAWAHGPSASAMP